MSGQGIIITPGVVTNTNSDGQTTQTPVIVTNVDPSGRKGECQCGQNYNFGNGGQQTPTIVINFGIPPQPGVGAVGQLQNAMGVGGTGLVNPLGVPTSTINSSIAAAAAAGLNTPLAVTAPVVNPLMAQSGYTMNPGGQVPVISTVAPDGTIIQTPASAATVAPIVPSSMFGSNYSGGASIIQTPAVVSNVTPDGHLTQTPAVVTNTAQIANVNPLAAAAALTAANNLVTAPTIANNLANQYDPYGQYIGGQYGQQYPSYADQNYGTGYQQGYEVAYNQAYNQAYTKAYQCAYIQGLKHGSALSQSNVNIGQNPMAMGMEGRYINQPYSAVVETPAIVSNVTPNGLITETPAVITNNAQQGMGYPYQAQPQPYVNVGMNAFNNNFTSPGYPYGQYSSQYQGQYNQYPSQYGQYPSQYSGQYSQFGQYGQYPGQFLKGHAAMIETPAVVSNVSCNGLVTETPAVITNITTVENLSRSGIQIDQPNLAQASFVNPSYGVGAVPHVAGYNQINTQIPPSAIPSAVGHSYLTIPSTPTYSVPSNPISAYSNINYPVAVGANSAINYLSPISPPSIPPPISQLPISGVNIDSPANVNLGLKPLTSIPQAVAKQQYMSLTPAVVRKVTQDGSVIQTPVVVKKRV